MLPAHSIKGPAKLEILGLSDRQAADRSSRLGCRSVGKPGRILWPDLAYPRHGAFLPLPPEPIDASNHAVVVASEV